MASMKPLDTMGDLTITSWGWSYKSGFTVVASMLVPLESSRVEFMAFGVQLSVGNVQDGKLGRDVDVFSAIGSVKRKFFYRQTFFMIDLTIQNFSSFKTRSVFIRFFLTK